MITRSWTQRAQVLANKHEQEWMNLVNEMEEQVAFEIEKRNQAETALLILWGIVSENKVLPAHQQQLVMSAIVNSGGYYGTPYAIELQRRLDALMELMEAKP